MDIIRMWYTSVLMVLLCSFDSKENVVQRKITLRKEEN